MLKERIFFSDVWHEIIPSWRKRKVKSQPWKGFDCFSVYLLLGFDFDLTPNLSLGLELNTSLVSIPNLWSLRVFSDPEIFFFLFWNKGTFEVLNFSGHMSVKCPLAGQSLFSGVLLIHDPDFQQVCKLIVDLFSALVVIIDPSDQESRFYLDDIDSVHLLLRRALMCHFETVGWIMCLFGSLSQHKNEPLQSLLEIEAASAWLSWCGSERGSKPREKTQQDSETNAANKPGVKKPPKASAISDTGFTAANKDFTEIGAFAYLFI